MSSRALYYALLLACTLVGCAPSATDTFLQLDDLRQKEIGMLKELNAKKDSTITILQFTVEQQASIIAVHDTLDLLRGCK